MSTSAVIGCRCPVYWNTFAYDGEHARVYSIDVGETVCTLGRLVLVDAVELLPHVLLCAGRDDQAVRGGRLRRVAQHVLHAHRLLLRARGERMISGHASEEKEDVKKPADQRTAEQQRPETAKPKPRSSRFRGLCCS